MGIQIQLLGKPAIIDSEGEAQPVRGHQSWALLARVLLSDRPLGRREVAAELFPDTDDPLGSLRWCLAAIRRALGSTESLTGDPIKDNLPEETRVDVWELETGDIDIEALNGLLDGIEPRCSTEFSTWLLVERERLASLIDERIRQETLQAISVSDYDKAIRIAERGVRRRPLDEGAQILLIKSLALSGRQTAAMDQVLSAEREFLAELGEGPTQALRAAASQSRTSPPSGISPQAVAKSLIESGLGALSGGAPDVGIERLRQAAEEAEKCQDRPLQAKALLELGTALVHAVRGYDDEGAVFLHRSVELAKQCGAEELATGGLREMGYVEAYAGRRPVALAYLEEALTSTEDSASLSGIHGVLGFNLVDWGRYDAGNEHFEKALDLGRRSNNLRRQVWALGIGALGQIAVGAYETAEDWLVEGLAMVDELRWVSFRPWPMALLAETRLRSGQDPLSLQSDLEEAFALACELRDPCWESQAARTLALTFAAREDFNKATDWFAEARHRCIRETDVYAALHVRILGDQAETLAASGQSKQANMVARELLSVAARAHMDHYVEKALSLLQD